MHPHVGVTAIEMGWRQPYRTTYVPAPVYEREVVRTTYDAPPVLVRSSTGRWVLYVQQRLSLRPSGVYDAATEAAVRAVQARAGLMPTGMTDMATWNVILSPTGLGFGWLGQPYGSYDPQSGGYGGYPYPYSLALYSNAGGRPATPGRTGR